MTTTTFGTGTAPTLTAMEPILPAPRPGLYLVHRLGGVTAHLTADQDTVHTVRALTRTVLLAHGVDLDTAESAQTVLSELVGNAVRAGGPHVPLVVEVYRVDHDAVITVHDPLAGISPRRTGIGLDDTDAESGRGLLILDILAPDWTVTTSATGKRIRCRIPAAR
jgi:anti-sigma regulatory factor (Ser/Thr protein kinase)